jgi:CheY-like chemotaxis protein
MDGYELTAAIRAEGRGKRRVPIAALTATALKGESERCRAADMDMYLTKPLQLADLRAALDELLLPAPRPVESPGAVPLDGLAAAAVDLRVLENLVGNDPAVIFDLLQGFQDNAGRTVALLKAACGVGDLAATIEQAHRLKSSSRAVGALVLGELCEEIESAGKAGAADTLAQLLPIFERESEAVNAFLVAFSQPSLREAARHQRATKQDVAD